MKTLIKKRTNRRKNRTWRRRRRTGLRLGACEALLEDGGEELGGTPSDDSRSGIYNL